MAKKKKNLSYQEKIQLEAAAQKAKLAKRNKKIALSIICSVALVAAIVLTIVFLSNTSSYYAKIEILGYGTITVKLDRDTAPVTACARASLLSPKRAGDPMISRPLSFFAAV